MSVHDRHSWAALLEIDTLCVPAWAATASTLVLVFQAVVARFSQRRNLHTERLEHIHIKPVTTKWSPLELVRLAACLVLLILSISIVDHKATPRRTVFALCATFTYTSFLALGSAIANSPLNHRFSAHLTTVLLVTWAVYAYRDLWPLATYHLKPADAEDPFVRVKMSVLTLAAVVVPLVTPREYVPINPENPSQEPSPEQTASIFSLATYSYLDGLIWRGSRTTRISSDQIPPLADYNKAEYLMELSLPALDPSLRKTPRHLFFGIVEVFWTEYVVICGFLAIRVIARMAAPVGIFKLLEYLQKGGEDVNIRPWVWVSWLFFGPLFGAMAMQTYVFLVTRVLIQAEGILTQLTYTHALRMRVKADTEGRGTGGASGIKSEKSGGMNSTGKIYNIVTSDVHNISEGRDFPQIFFYAPIQITLNMVFLYSILGWSAFVGLAVIIALFPVPGYMSTFLQTVQKEKMRKTDARVQSVSETMTVIRMIKMFAWEQRTSEQLDEKREEELKYLRKFKILSMVNTNVNFLIPVLTMVSTFFAYTVLMGGELTASRVFSAMSLFDVIREQLSNSFQLLPDVIRAKVSLDRVTEYLNESELLDQYAKTESPSECTVMARDDVIGIRNATFTWADSDSKHPNALERFALLVEEEVVFQRGQVNIIVGATGSGKTATLLALLGEMHCALLSPESYVSLPRSGGVAYVPQEPWILSDTIKANIIFGAPLDEARYQSVLDQCGLAYDLSLFDDGDMTHVGERGLTLSGGQKARVSLARAVYSSADILLIDDVFAALDIHTSRWIVDKCFKGDVIRGRTLLLVTHHVALVKPIASFAVVIQDGRVRVAEQGEVFHLAAKENASSEEPSTSATVKPDRTADEVARPVSKVATSGKPLQRPEEVSEGHVAWRAISDYLSAMGGHHALFFWMATIAFMAASEIFSVLQTYWLGYWAQQYENESKNSVRIEYYLGVFIGILVADYALLWVGQLVYVFGSIRASRDIHRSLIESVLGSTLRWLDRTPSARIITRCTQDIQCIDGALANSLKSLLDKTVSMTTKFVSIMVVSPAFSIPGAAFAILGGWCGQMYMKTQLPVKREQSNARAPIVDHLGTTVTGLVSVRAYGAQDRFVKESCLRIDRWSRATRTFFNLNRWIGFRLEALSAFVSACLAAYLVYGTHTRAATTGFALNMAVGFSGTILWWVRVLNNFEVNGNSLERIEQYINIEHEPKPNPTGVPPAYWPASGNLRVEGLSAKYSSDGPRILHDITFEVQSGERVGIVGRTGSGKSSLALALLRLIETEGKIFFDGIRTDKINLDALRSNITIIPQIPELLSGTLRRNLDPQGEFTDAAMNDALRSAGLFSLSHGGNPLSLDSQIASGGGNLSIGQRQIVALARAILRQSKLLILDEATSAIDYETDAVIQQSLRDVLDKGVTVLTIAHRLQTVVDADKILVLDSGRVAEFGPPGELMKNEEGLLYALVKESGRGALCLLWNEDRDWKGDIWDI